MLMSLIGVQNNQGGRGCVIVQSIGKKLKTKLIGRHIYYYEELGSTQELAIYLAENNSQAVTGTAILAEHQGRGRGRAKQ